MAALLKAFMEKLSKLRAVLAVPLVLALTACGSGGGSSTDGGPGPQPPVAPPSSGTYSWLLKAEGATDNLKYGLSLLHPQDSSVEWAIEPANAAVTDAKLVASAALDTSASRTGPLKPYALVYIVGGDVRRVPLEANGSAPASRVRKAGSSSACVFVLDAVDYAVPEQSRFVVSTAGLDGKCNTADDGRAEVRLGADASVSLAPLTDDLPLAALRDPTSLAPRGWLTRTRATLWSSPTSSIQLRPDTNPITKVLGVTPQSALVESAGGLSVIDFTGGTGFKETLLNSVTTTGWQPIGFDAQNYYVYRNGSTATALNWTVSKVTRSSPSATTLASGAGEVSVASMGVDVLFANVIGTNVQDLRRIRKAVPGASDSVDSGPAVTSLSSVLTSASGVHLLWRLTGLGSAAPNYSIEMIDESGTKIYTSAPGGFSLGLADAPNVNFGNSENRSVFLFVEGYGKRFFGDATLTAYDTALRSARRLGALPGSTEFGTDLVFANVVSGPATFATGYASRSINGVVQGSGTKVFTFDTATTSSLKTSSRQQ
jgi:hypothetical protein